MKTVDLTVPLLFEWQTHKFLHGPIFFSLGPVIGIKTYSSTKTKYTTADGQKIQLFEKGIKPNPSTSTSWPRADTVPSAST